MNKRIGKFLLISFIFIFNNTLLAEPRVIKWEDLSPMKGLGVKLKLIQKRPSKVHLIYQNLMDLKNN